MPRGGGFRGGGFRGGGFRGGGFGGGFRGGGRIGNVRTSGRPFGRTGANRIVSRSPSGPYRHNLYRPHRRYYRPWWWYHRPWYYRWWYSPWWAGHYYRPWYYSPMYIGGGILFIIIFALILLPVFGVAFLFPFSEADVNGFVNYRSTETLYFNEFWYEYENIEDGRDIDFTIQSSLVGVTFAIWDRPFDSLPTESVDIPIVDSFTLPSGWRIYEWQFLRPESSIEYAFNASGQIDFFFANWNEFEIWDQYGPNPSYYIEDTDQHEGSLTINSADDYFLVWYNEGGSPVDIDYSINYTATNVINFSVTPVNAIDTTYYSGTYQVSHSGNWYFFIYFDPMNVPPPDASTTITFDVTYDTGITSVERWLDIQWILIIILVIVVILLIAALIARRGQKKLKLKSPTEKTPGVSPYKKVAKKADEIKEVSNCIRCNTPLKPGAKFCIQCGGKVEGRKTSESSITTPVAAKNCSLCGSKISGTENFCKWCGTKIEK